MRPTPLLFPRRFQNAIETWLYFANILVITLGAAYTLLNVSNPDANLQSAIEYAMLFVLAAGCSFAALYLAYGWYAHKPAPASVR